MIFTGRITAEIARGLCPSFCYATTAEYRKQYMQVGQHWIALPIYTSIMGKLHMGKVMRATDEVRYIKNRPYSLWNGRKFTGDQVQHD